MDVVPKAFLKSSLLLNGQCGIQVRVSPKQQPRPLPSILSDFSSMVDTFYIDLQDIQSGGGEDPELIDAAKCAGQPAAAPHHHQDRGGTRTQAYTTIHTQSAVGKGLEQRSTCYITFSIDISMAL